MYILIILYVNKSRTRFEEEPRILLNRDATLRCVGVGLKFIVLLRRSCA